MRWCRDVIAPLLVASVPPAVPFSAGQCLIPASSAAVQPCFRQSSGRHRWRSLSSRPSETVPRRRWALLRNERRAQVGEGSSDTATPPPASAATAAAAAPADAPAPAAAAVAVEEEAGVVSPGTIYTIDVGVHPDVASIAVKHALQLRRFVEHYPIKANSQEAYDFAAKFVREFHHSREGRDRDAVGEGQEQGDGAVEGVLPPRRRRLPVVLDSGCGTGRSSVMLARSHPHLPVLGVDRSAVRLSKGRGRGGGNKATRVAGNHQDNSRVGGVGKPVHEARSTDAAERNEPGGPNETGPGGGGRGVHRSREVEVLPANLLLLRADLVDLWIVASREDAWEVTEHSILYPNPYPKHSQLGSRWHGHSVFPVILCLGGRITVRSNWKSYLEELCQAVLAIAGEANNSEGDAAGTAGTVSDNRLEASRGPVLARGPDSSGNVGLAAGATGGKEDFADGRRDADMSEGVPANIKDAAASYVASARAGPVRFSPVMPATNFEAKYEAVGETLYELRLEPRLEDCCHPVF